MILCLVASLPSQAAAPPATTEAAARRLIEWTDEPGNRTRAIALLEEALIGGEGVGLLTLLAHAYYLRATDDDDRDRAVRDLDAAITRSDRALAIAPGHLPARYWRGVSLLGKAGRLRGIESFGLVRGAMRELEAVAAAAPLLDGAGAHRAMGKVYLDSPWWFLGDTEKAIGQLEAARRLAPNSLTNRLFLAEAYAAHGREEDALREIEALLNAPPTPGRSIAEATKRDQARNMAARIRTRLKKP